MKPTLMLSDEPEIVMLLLKEVTSGGMAVRKSEARADCNCDRWGHPCLGSLEPKKTAGRRRSSFITSQTAR
jgi:hypothetical protein